MGNRSLKVLLDLTNSENPITQEDVFAYSADSNRLAGVNGQTFKYDAAGNILVRDLTKALNVPAELRNKIEYTYDVTNRMTSASVDGAVQASYKYNAFGERVVKTDTLGISTVYHFNGSGQVIGETMVSGNGTELQNKTYVWLNDKPVAMIVTQANTTQLSTNQISYLHFDHLNTPRLATSQGQKVVWNWQSDAFGVGLANVDVDGDSAGTEISLRFPGQVFDAETGLNYNYFRDYDPSLGRYLQSDPIGLAGGINTYAYVGGNPVSYVDPFGLSRFTADSLGSASIDIANPTGQQLMDALSAVPDGTLQRARLTGHANNFAQCISSGQVCRDYFDNNLDVYSDGKKIGNLQELLKRKLMSGGDLEFAGCHNADGDKNLTKAASRQLPGIPVTGGLGPQWGFDDNPIFGNSDGLLGAKRTYLDEVLQ